MTEEEKIEDIQKEFLDIILENIEETGSTYPTLGLITKSKEKENNYTLMLMPIPPEFMKDQKAKDNFVSKMLPSVKNKLVQKNLEVKTLCFSTEAYMRIAPKGQEEEMSYEEIQKLPAKDILMITFEDRYDTEVKIYEVEKTTLVNPQGEMIQEAKLTYLPENSMKKGENHVSMGGTFSGLFKIFDPGL